MSRGPAFFGWYVVFAAFWVALFGWGFGFYGLAVYVAALRNAHGWSVALIGAMATGYYLFGALLLTFYPAAVRRLGQRTVTLVGIVAMAASVVGVAMARTPWELAAAYLLMAVGWSTMSLTAVTAMIAPWFVRRRGLAMSLALNGASCGGILLAPALLWMSTALGFAAAAGVTVLVMLVVLIPMVAAWVGRTPADLGLTVDPNAASTDASNSGPDDRPASRRGELLRSRAYWSVAAPFALGLLAQVGFVTHQVAFLQPYLGTRGAGGALALTTTAAVTGRLLLGLLLDRLDPRLTTAACLASQAAALLAMGSSHAPPVLYAGSIVFGLSVGNLITLPALVVQREFPARDFLVAVALIAATSQIFYAFGPGLVGLARELGGGYGSALGLCIVLEVVAAAVLVRGAALFRGAAYI